MITNENIIKAYERISPYIKNTEIFSIAELNKKLNGHEILFKNDASQVTGSFKVRGVLNTLLYLKEQNKLPKNIVAYSTGNHAKAISYMAKKFAINAKIYMPEFSASAKIEAVKNNGAELILTKTRRESEILSRAEGLKKDHYFLAPSDNDIVIQGAATLCYESLLDSRFKEDRYPDAIFGSIGGGALVSGAYLAAKCFSDKIKIFAAEPINANDASISFKNKKIFSFQESPVTIADGVVTLSLSERTFKYIKNIEDVIEVSEEEIAYWTIWLNNIIDVPVETTAALSLAAAYKWLMTQNTPQKILVILSGGNLSNEAIDEIKNISFK
jgi:threonine dehydratase